jgi:succinate-acetate transporter protein
VYRREVKDVSVAQAGNAVGLYPDRLRAVHGLMLIPSFKRNRGINVVLALPFVTLMLLGISNAGGHTTLIYWGGYVGLAAAAAAAYTSVAEVTNDTFLPVDRSDASPRALHRRDLT